METDKSLISHQVPYFLHSSAPGRWALPLIPLNDVQKTTHQDGISHKVGSSLIIRCILFKGEEERSPWPYRCYLGVISMMILIWLRYADPEIQVAVGIFVGVRGVRSQWGQGRYHGFHTYRMYLCVLYLPIRQIQRSSSSRAKACFSIPPH